MTMDWSRWTTTPYYALVIFIIACGSIPKGKLRLGALSAILLFSRTRKRVRKLTSPGAASGYDEGGYSASVKLDAFTHDFNLVSSNWENDPTGLANRKANITSFNVLGAAFGALFALDLNDRLGRLNAWRLGALVWASGTFIQVFASGIYGLLLFARIWSGLGAGLLTVVVPVYLSEIGMEDPSYMLTCLLLACIY